VTEKHPAVTVEMLAAAAACAGLRFSDAELALMLDGLREYVERYEQIRGVPIDNSVPPALMFDPGPPEMMPPTGQPPLPERAGIAPQASANLEELAFAPVTLLSQLIQSRQVSSVALTEMYLRRLKRYDPALRCVVTLTEELALEQARHADAEIAAGRYRGPLHGIPWGAKDLLATRGIRTTWGAAPYADQVPDHDATVVQRLEVAGAGRQADDGRAGLGRCMVRWADEKPLEARRGIERLLGRPCRGDGGRAGRLRDRHRDLGVDRLTRDALPRDRTAPDLRARQPPRRDGAELEHGQDRPDLPLG
jgi:Amidase